MFPGCRESRSWVSPTRGCLPFPGRACDFIHLISARHRKTRTCHRGFTSLYPPAHAMLSKGERQTAQLPTLHLGWGHPSPQVTWLPLFQSWGMFPQDGTVEPLVPPNTTLSEHGKESSLPLSSRNLEKQGGMISTQRWVTPGSFQTLDPFVSCCNRPRFWKKTSYNLWKNSKSRFALGVM